MQDILKLINSKQLLIFDFDGTIADTSPFHEQAFKKVLNPLNIKFVYKDIAGMNSYDALCKIFQQHHKTYTGHNIQKLALRKQSIARDLIKKNLYLEPCVKLFLDWAYQQPNFALCIVSSGSRQTIELSIKKLGLKPYFNFLICAEDVKNAKPSPDGFLMALNQANLTHEHAIIFEDSQAGFQSAKNANINFLKVTENFWEDISNTL